MKTLTLKLPEQLDEQLAQLARREHLSKSEVVSVDLMQSLLV
jgi:hypothetical protein